MRSLKASRIAPRHAAIGALALAILPATAFALTPPGATVPADPLALRAPALDDSRLAFGQRAEVRGQLAASAAGRRLALQFAPHARRWRTVETTVVDADGTYSFRIRARESGAVRVVAAPADVAGAADEGGATFGEGGAAFGGAPLESRARRMTVAAKLVVVGRGGHDAGVGEAVRVRGTLLPRTRGRRVVVEAGARGHWQPVARTRTRAGGRFSARVVARQLGTQRLRVRFAGDRRNAPARARAGTLQAFRPALATWYDLSGNTTACGQTLHYETLGVAHKTLPCGTRVTFRYHGREVTVPVIDRGPYAGAREWDLTGAAARHLGLISVGVDVVWSTK